MTRAISATVICVASRPPLAQTPTQPSEGPVVVTSGEAIVKRAPDRAWVQIAAESRARSPREAQKLNADAMSAVLQKLKGPAFRRRAADSRLRSSTRIRLRQRTADAARLRGTQHGRGPRRRLADARRDPRHGGAPEQRRSAGSLRSQEGRAAEREALAWRSRTRGAAQTRRRLAPA